LTDATELLGSVAGPRYHQTEARGPFGPRALRPAGALVELESAWQAIQIETRKRNVT
jgi:hypothetical protein